MLITTQIQFAAHTKASEDLKYSTQDAWTTFMAFYGTFMVA